ncbi:formate/nitrite transporter family protein [Mycoplasma sp. P36-A1]|uniref:formate/nitrite transporter family protein n=1 Tax=Mycoplasma sp. P36-A1 TaxID=3252900 RepID=UPI003C2D85C2
MYEALIDDVNSVALEKLEASNKNTFNFFIASIIAGFFIGFGCLLIFSISGQLGNTIFTKIAMAASFGIALSLVVMAGSELFTGNNFVLGVALLSKKAKVKETIKLWSICYLGNLIGSVLLSILFVGTGLNHIGGNATSDATANALQHAANLKMHGDFFNLFCKGILCNILVCLAVLCSIKLKSESGKLIMIWWCLFAFNVIGFEHCVANMTILTSSLLANHGSTLSIGGMFYNLFATSFGNLTGGLLVAIAYFGTVSKKYKLNYLK